MMILKVNLSSMTLDIAPQILLSKTMKSNVNLYDIMIENDLYFYTISMVSIIVQGLGSSTLIDG